MPVPVEVTVETGTEKPDPVPGFEQDGRLEPCERWIEVLARPCASPMCGFSTLPAKGAMLKATERLRNRRPFQWSSPEACWSPETMGKHDHLTD
jgi:hypothetical protein